MFRYKSMQIQCINFETDNIKIERSEMKRMFKAKVRTKHDNKKQISFRKIAFKKNTKGFPYRELANQFYHKHWCMIVFYHFRFPKQISKCMAKFFQSRIV